ncbi:MAG: ABC transporter substrate-binding protein [Firmicutes bacterium]|nr:ABC transporter substrate-binding protein [Bacillota bacterium]MDY6159506.1 ABC transporter substrate-binding protein [Candidatus Faecousia sp.]
MKKLLAIVLALAMVLPMVLSASAAQYPALEEMDDQQLYDENLGEFYDMYMEALECMDVDQRYALEALAEAKLLQTSVLLPTTSNYGNYAIGRTVPKTANGTLWGNDSDRQYSILATKEIIKAADRDALKAMWMEAPDAATYVAEAKAYLADNGYTLEDEYKYPSSSDPQTWDALNTYLQADSRPLVQLCDGLMMYDLKNTQQFALAESYEANEDMTVFTFKIRQGVKWVDSQGREIGEVTADDFVAGMQHMLDCQAGLEWLVDGLIVGAAEYMYGETTDFADVGVKALDEYTLEYTLCDSTPYFLTMLGYNIFFPMNRAYFLSQGGAFGVDEFAAAKESASYKYGTSPDTIAYNGPFLVKSFTEKNTIVFEANPTYYNPDILGVHTLTWKYDDGTDNTKTYKDMVAGDITNAGLNTATMEIAKADGLFDEYAYVSETDATAFVEWLNIDRKAYANYNDPNVAVSTHTEDQQLLAQAAMRNVHFRRAVHYSIDRATMVAQRKGEDLKYNSMINAYVPGNFVYLSKDVTVEINGESVTFPAGTAYGTIRQAQLEADGSHIKSFDEETGLGTGFDGWYNPEVAVAELEIAIAELAEQGYEISAENPVRLDIASFTGNDSFKNQDQATKQSIEEVLGGVVIVDIVPCETQMDWLNATYYPNTGDEMNFDIGNNGGWGPDYGDPKSYLDTMLPGANGMSKSFGLF